MSKTHAPGHERRTALWSRSISGSILHKATFQACAISATGTRLWEAQFPRTADGIAAFAARGVAHAAVAVEATGPTWAFVDAVRPLSAAVCVVDTRKTKLKAGFAAKTDRLDARRLADALRRESVVSIYIPPPAIREWRELCRGRQHLVRVRSKLIQTIRALLLRQDVADPPMTPLMRPRALAWLETVRLAGSAGETLQRYTRLLRAVQAECVAAQQRVEAAAAADPIAVALADAGRRGTGAEPHPACRDWDHRAVSARPVSRERCGMGLGGQRQCEPRPVWGDHSGGVAVAPVGPGGSRRARGDAARRRRPLGAAAGGAKTHQRPHAWRSRGGCVTRLCACGDRSNDVLSRVHAALDT